MVKTMDSNNQVKNKNNKEKMNEERFKMEMVDVLQRCINETNRVISKYGYSLNKTYEYETIDFLNEIFDYDSKSLKACVTSALKDSDILISKQELNKKKLLEKQQLIKQIKDLQNKLNSLN